MENCDRVELNGMKVFPFSSPKQLLEYVDSHKGILVAVNAEKVTKATDETRAIVNNNIGYADGAGVVVAMHELGHPEAVRIAGCDLWLDIIRESYRGMSFYLVGGKQEVIDETIAKLKREFEGINIVGYRNGYIKTNEERNALIQDVAAKKPDVVYVAMGSPKQEMLMADMMKQHQAIYQGLGGSFDVYTGRVKRAPLWWQKHNLEFLYRFLKQPQRYRREYYRLKFLYWMMIGKFKVNKI
jgi:bacterial polymer biosynthesis proteins, WecB/TagA/CpsF family